MSLLIRPPIQSGDSASAARQDAPYRVLRISTNDMNAWDSYVRANAQGGPMHWAGWLGVLQDVFAVEPLFLAAFDQSDALRGVLATYISSSLVGGRHGASLQGGILADDSQAATALFENAMNACNRSNCKFLVLRGGQRPSTAEVGSIQVVHTLIDTSKPLDMLFGALKKKTRWLVRGCAGLDFNALEGTPSELEQFQRLYAQSQHRVGTPVPSRKFFPAIFKHFGKRVRLFSVSLQGQMIAGMVCVSDATGWTSLYAARDPAPMAANNGYLLYWGVIEWMHKNNVLQFDLGRSAPGSGVHKFKSKWGGTDVYHDHLYYGNQASASIDNFKKIHSGYTLKQRVWQALPPSLCNTLGPMLRRNLPMG